MSMFWIQPRVTRCACVIEVVEPIIDTRLESWDDPTPRESSRTKEELDAAWLAACKLQYSLRPKSPSREERIKRRQEHDRKGLIIALDTYAKKNNMQATELEFVEVKERNLVDEYGKGYVHFNFLMKNSEGTFTLFFAELHPDCRRDEDVYLCCPLDENDSGNILFSHRIDENDSGPCFGCNGQAKNLMHPTGGGYLGGHIDVGFPSVELDSDDDCFI